MSLSWLLKLCQYRIQFHMHGSKMNGAVSEFLDFKIGRVRRSDMLVQPSFVPATAEQPARATQPPPHLLLAFVQLRHITGRRKFRLCSLRKKLGLDQQWEAPSNLKLPEDADHLCVCLCVCLCICLCV